MFHTVPGNRKMGPPFYRSLYMSNLPGYPRCILREENQQKQEGRVRTGDTRLMECSRKAGSRERMKHIERNN